MRLVREAPLRSTEVVVVLRPGIGPRTTTTPVEPSRGSRTPAIPTTTPVEPVLTSEPEGRRVDAEGYHAYNDIESLTMILALHDAA